MKQGKNTEKSPPKADPSTVAFAVGDPQNASIGGIANNAGVRHPAGVVGWHVRGYREHTTAVTSDMQQVAASGRHFFFYLFFSFGHLF